jgi:hypothetical protein
MQGFLGKKRSNSEPFERFPVEHGYGWVYGTQFTGFKRPVLRKAPLPIWSIAQG